MLAENIPLAGGYVYFMKNKSGSVLYIGSTENLLKRIWEHKSHAVEKSFTDKYNVEKLVYFECYPDLSLARDREYKLKKWRREKKENLINAKNKWQHDLAENWFDESYKQSEDFSTNNF
ncbi:hypothetical protein CSB37_04305 [bacterium DOLZORAL124_38_8]|nr:MAG: hypothetical protein CSB37_04305 [bacterium DOLZORAL124_38_8]